jgi:hypothetical protein
VEIPEKFQAEVLSLMISAAKDQVRCRAEERWRGEEMCRGQERREGEGKRGEEMRREDRVM